MMVMNKDFRLSEALQRIVEADDKVISEMSDGLAKKQAKDIRKKWQRLGDRPPSKESKEGDY